MKTLSLMEPRGPTSLVDGDLSMTNQEITMVMFNAPSDQVVGETANGPIHGWVKAGYEPVLTALDRKSTRLNSSHRT